MTYGSWSARKNPSNIRDFKTASKPRRSAASACGVFRRCDIITKTGKYLSEWVENPLLFCLFAVERSIIISDVEKTLAANLPDVEVVDVEVAGTRGSPVIQVFIDHPDGVSHELCTKVTGLLGDYLLDHTVEVSSPGLERRLRKPDHFRNAIGQKINVKTFGPVEGQRNFTGFLLSADGQALTLDMEENRRMTIPLHAVAKARTVLEFGDKPKPGKKRRKKA